MNKYIIRGTAAAAAAVVMAAVIGCQTAKPALATAAESAVQVEKTGFSPAAAAAAGQNSIDISLLFGSPEAIESWKVEVTGNGLAQKTWTGDAKYLPASLTWDGNGESGAISPEGAYAAKLTIDYGSKYQAAAAESRSFVLDVTAPTGTISLDPPELTPLEKGVARPMTLTINASSALARMDSWSMDIFDAAGGLVKNWSGQWPNASAAWDGASLDGGFVSPGAVYSAVATVRDEYGNSAQLKSKITVAALQSPSPVVPAVAPVQPAPPVRKPGEVSIAAQGAGFSPNGDQVDDAVSFAVGYGQPASVKAWKAAITDSAGKTLKAWGGDGSDLPGMLTWDGKADSGAMAPEGEYSATLAVDYGSSFSAATAQSSTFVLAVTPPTGTISLSSALYSPMESSDTITLTLAAFSKTAKIDSWTMDIYDPGGNVFRSFSAKWPAKAAVWNGRSTGGELVQSAEDYTVVARVRDQFGNVGSMKTTVPVDILVEKTQRGYRILASRIFFKAFTADYGDVASDLAEQNASRLDQLAAKLKKFPGYNITIVGHAVMINWDKPQAGREEQDTILIPLSKARADAVEAALVERGLEQGRFSTDGVGASDQLVPDSNYKDRWQNRRVALFLQKE